MKSLVVKFPGMKTDIKTDFQWALRYHFVANGENDSKVARSVGCSPQHIRKIRIGEGKGSETIRRAIAEHFGFTYESFLEFGRKVRRVEKPELEPPTPDPLPPTGLNELYRTIGAIEQRIQDLKTDIDNRYKALEERLAEQEMRTQKKEMAPDTKKTGTDGAS